MQHTVVLVHFVLAIVSICFVLIKVSHFFLVFYCILHLIFTCTTLWSSCAFAAVWSIFPWKLDFELITFKLNPGLQSGVVFPNVIIVTGAVVVIGWWCVVVGWQLWMWVWLRCCGIHPGSSDRVVYPTSSIPDRSCSWLVYLYHTGHWCNWTVKALNKYF